MNSLIEEILKENKVTCTPGRKKILELFLKSNSALVRAEIENALPSVDRIIMWRTLQTLLQKGIIHLIPTTDISIKYAFSKNYKINKHFNKDHVHFCCSKCHKTVCLYDVKVPTIKLPRNYKKQYHELVITGICSDCK
jgi:Fur family ferric uptake transcriptional regulator